VAEDNHATKEDLAAVEHGLKQDIAAVEHGLKKDMVALEHGLRQEMTALEHRLKQDMVAVEQRLTRLIEQTLEVSRNMETSLLTAFHSYAKGNAARLVKMEGADVSSDLRLNALEERVLALETRRSA
jgi:hypothetical protein